MKCDLLYMHAVIVLQYCDNFSHHIWHFCVLIDHWLDSTTSLAAQEVTDGSTILLR